MIFVTAVFTKVTSKFDWVLDGLIDTARAEHHHLSQARRRSKQALVQRSRYLRHGDYSSAESVSYNQLEKKRVLLKFCWLHSLCWFNSFHSTKGAIEHIDKLRVQKSCKET